MKHDCKESDRYGNVYKVWYDSTENQASLSVSNPLKRRKQNPRWCKVYRLFINLKIS